MFKNLVASAVKDKVGTSKVVETFKDAYDYIIVGAGAAGNVLADRLSSSGTASVLLLEAGGDDAAKPQVHIPTSAARLNDSDFDYKYSTVPQKRACRNMKNCQAFYPRGKGLGGSGSINFLIYTRGSRYDFDEWEDMGCSGWSYRSVLPYFMKCENNSNADYLTSGYHGSSGPMKVGDLQMTPLVQTFLNAGVELGYDIVDVNGPNQLGFSNMQGHISDGMRCSTAHGYLRPAMTRDNLDVAIHSQVLEIVSEDNQVTGVRVMKDEQTYHIAANCEVIVSAGAVESPKLLMLSGIGPRDELEKHGIQVKASLPVGRNLQDHPLCLLEYTVERPLSLHVNDSTLSSSAEEYQQYMFFNSGYLGKPGAQGALAFFRTRLAAENYMYPDILVQMSTGLVGAAYLRNLRDEVSEQIHKSHHQNQQSIYLSNLLLHPKSTGTVQLSSRNASDPPIIDPKFLDHADDARVLVEGLKLQLQLGQTESFQRIGASLSTSTMLDSPDLQTYSESYLEKYVRHNTMTGHHASGTCRMGRENDANAVVDPQLRVIGFEGLRVVDASVMPKVPSANTGAATMMIAERAADLILGEDSVADIDLPEEFQDEIATRM